MIAPLALLDWNTGIARMLRIRMRSRMRRTRTSHEENVQGEIKNEFEDD